MKKFFKKISSIPWYPFLFSAYPVLALFGNNVEEARMAVIVRPLLVYLAGTLLCLFVFRLILRDWHRAAFVTSMWVVLFSTYGHLISYLLEKKVAYTSSLILAIWLILAVLPLLLVFRIKNKIFAATGSLNLIALVLLAYPLYQAGSEVARKMDINGRSVQAAPVQEVSPISSDDLPDIYYIILDSYTRSDLMQKAYGYDNSAFLSKLEEMGFYVASCSQSNFMRTDLSLASTLNMDYVQNLSDTFKPETYNRTKLFELLKYNAVRKTLEAAGYRTIAFETGFHWSEWDDADVFMGPSPISSDLTSFEELLLKTTMLRVLVDTGMINAEEISGNHYRERTSFALDSLPELVKYPGPIFAFVHIISPHPPFVFGPDGEPTNPNDFLNSDQKIPAKSYALGYTNQVTYLNTRLEKILETLIKGSDRPPVILLQGDHGPWMQPDNKRFWILNAYYLPGHNKELYPSISPVNSFRIVLNDYLGTSYDLLADKSYFSPIPYIYDFKSFANPCQ